MSIKIHLMLNSKMLIDAHGDQIAATSLLEASNLVGLKVVILCIFLASSRTIICIVLPYKKLYCLLYEMLNHVVVIKTLLLLILMQI